MCDSWATSSNVLSLFLGCQNEGCHMNIVLIYIPVWVTIFFWLVWGQKNLKALLEARQNESLINSVPESSHTDTRVMGRSENSVDSPPACYFPNKENQWTQTFKQRVDLAAAEHFFSLCFTHCAVWALQTSEQLFSDQPWREADWLLKSPIRGTFTSQCFINNHL